MENNVDYINLEYVLLNFQDVASTLFSVAIGVPAFVVSAITALYVLGMVLSLVFLILIVYAQIQLLNTEHAGFHALEGHGHDDHHGGHDTHSEEHHEEVSQINDRWMRIMELASSGNQSDWRRAILEADIMLGDSLTEAGYLGTSVGEQLKMANPIQLTTLDLAWKAHKVRNEVAHGGEKYMLGERDTKVAIDYYKRVFEELGVL